MDTLYTILDVSWAALYGDVHPQTLSFSYGMPMGACATDIVPRPFGDAHAEAVMVNRFVHFVDIRSIEPVRSEGSLFHMVGQTTTLWLLVPSEQLSLLHLATKELTLVASSPF